MPSITKRRLWCEKCQEWELFTIPIFNKDENPLVCGNCKTEYQEVDLKDIPEEKIKEQRIRWLNKNKNSISSYFDHAMRGNLINALLEPEIGITIIESDAGQEEISKAEMEKFNEERNRKIEIYRGLVKEYQDFKHLGRNKPCACGSGKKYKKCCLPKWKDFDDSFNY